MHHHAKLDLNSTIREEVGSCGEAQKHDERQILRRLQTS